MTMVPGHEVSQVNRRLPPSSVALPCIVLVPNESRTLFAALPQGAFAPLFYNFREANIAERIGHRLGAAAVPQIEVEAGGDLTTVTKLWLGSTVRLSNDETERLLARLPCLEWVYSQRTGVDHLPLDIYRKRGIAVSNSGDLSSLWVAEMHLACVLSHAKRLPTHAALQRHHQWDSILGRELKTMRILVIGTGRIGGHTARLCRAIGMHVVGASRSPERFSNATHDFDLVVPLNLALKQHIADADAVILALPLSPQTRGLISADVLRLMQPDAVFINLARPSIVDERALVMALQEGRLGAAWMSSTESLGFWARRKAERLSNFHLTHSSEAHVASKLRHAFRQFTTLAGQPTCDVESRIV